MQDTNSSGRNGVPTSTVSPFTPENVTSSPTPTNRVLMGLLKGGESKDSVNASQHADLGHVHAQSKSRKTGRPTTETLRAFGEEYQSLTATRGGRLYEKNVNRSSLQAIAPDGQPHQTGQSVTKHSPDESSDSVVEVDSTDSSDDSSDDEFGTEDNPKMSPETRADYEELVFTAKQNTTLKYKKAWEDAKKLEDEAIRSNRLKKYGLDMMAGAANQVTSFGVAGISATMAGNPWVFPIVAMLTSDFIGDRLAQLIRGSTMVAVGTRTHFENHRQMARALGDVLESCAGRTPKRKFTVTVTDPETGTASKQKMTAFEALQHTGCLGGLSAWGQNLLVRGLPFLWFSAIYGSRDFYMNYQCPGSFYPPTTSSPWSNSTLPTGCSDPEQVDPAALRWSMVLLSGMMAGALTSVSNQLLTACLPHEERTNYSRDTYAKEVRYKESALADCKSFLDYLGTPDAKDEEAPLVIDGVETLKRILEKELRVARKKSSLWTTFQGELDLATQKHRDENMITPEFGGKRLELFMSMLGKFLTLLSFAYVSSRFVVRTSEEEQDKIMGLILIPLSLIILGGYAFRDDARLVGQLPYGAVKGAFRACKGQAGDQTQANAEVQASTAMTVPHFVTREHSGSEDSGDRTSVSQRDAQTERIHSTSTTPARRNVSQSDEDQNTSEDESVIV